MTPTLHMEPTPSLTPGPSLLFSFFRREYVEELPADPDYADRRRRRLKVRTTLAAMAR